MYSILANDTFFKEYNLLDFIMKAKYSYLDVSVITFRFDGKLIDVDPSIIDSLVNVNGIEYDNPLEWVTAILRGIFLWDSIPEVMVNGKHIADDVILDIAITNDYTGKIERMFYPYGREGM